MRKMIFILVFFVSNSIFAQIEIDWLKLRDVYYKSEYREEMYGYFQIPYFGEELESLDNKEVRITGYMLTLAPDEGVFVLSQNPYADCFFCGFGGLKFEIKVCC